MFTASRIYLDPPQPKVDPQETAKSSAELDDIAQAVLAEREACAALCEQLQDWPESSTPYDCAAAIRARNAP